MKEKLLKQSKDMHYVTQKDLLSAIPEKLADFAEDGVKNIKSYISDIPAEFQMAFLRSLLGRNAELLRHFAKDKDIVALVDKLNKKVEDAK